MSNPHPANQFKKGHAGYKSNLGKKFSAEWRKKISEGHMGQVAWNKGLKGVQISHNKGKKFPYQPRPALRGRTPWNKGTKNPEMCGPNNHAWRGGVTPINEKIRKSTQYIEWRKHVFQRDDYTCQACGERGGKLHADHELPFALYPELRFEILNGRTLCVPCHRKIPANNKHWLISTYL